MEGRIPVYWRGRKVYNPVWTNCDFCGVRFPKNKYQFNNTKLHFCSAKCCSDYAVIREADKRLWRTKMALKKGKTTFSMGNYSGSRYKFTLKGEQDAEEREDKEKFRASYIISIY